MKVNPFHEFLWEKDGNGWYTVTDKLTGEAVTAIPRLGKPYGRYCIRESEERETNYYGQSVPKIYNRFEVMAFCRARGERKNGHAYARGLPDA